MAKSFAECETPLEATQVADRATIFAHQNCVLADRKKEILSKYAIWDATNYYLVSQLRRPEYIRINRKHFSEAIINMCTLYPFLSHDSVLFRVD